MKTCRTPHSHSISQSFVHLRPIRSGINSNTMLNKENFHISVEGKEIELDRTSLKAGNITNLPNNRISLITGNRSYTSKVLQVNTADKKVTLQMDGKCYQIKIQDELDMQLKTMGFNNSSARKLKEIKAPMPGMVLEVNVQEGNQLEAGSKLLVLEAMKMENVIVLPAGSRIKKILVKKGEAVQKNQVLMELDHD